MAGPRALRPGAPFEGKYLCTRFTELFLEYDAEPSSPVSDGGISALAVTNQAYGLDDLVLRVTQVSCNGQGLGGAGHRCEGKKVFDHRLSSQKWLAPLRRTQRFSKRRRKTVDHEAIFRTLMR